MEPWSADAAGVLTLPSGRLVRGRGLRYPVPDGPLPTYGLCLLATPPPRLPWETRWVQWPDFRLPSDRLDAIEALRDAWRRLDADRVEVACGGGRGRTGTALACLVALDARGMPGTKPVDPVGYVREHYDRRAVETPWQRRFVARLAQDWCA